MIRINLLGVERQKAKKALAFDPAARMTLVCSLILVVSALGIGWWYWSLSQESVQVDRDIIAAQQEAARLKSLLAEVRQFEQQQAQLQQRVVLIQQLRRGQSVPVQLLDHISRSMPDTLWLTSLDQKGNVVTIEGRTTTLISVSDFVANLGSSTLLKKPIDLVNSQADPENGAPPGTEVIKFSVKATLDTPDSAATDAAPAKPAAAKPAKPAR
ncbi:MAG TPA: PilN domain-containing protein [Vicinamibacterales bacterium]|jgi:type IV pilus assembly protein PilN|nr:PilN domain-containing protein [Vicinamibacterales bacterium]